MAGNNQSRVRTLAAVALLAIAGLAFGLVSTNASAGTVISAGSTTIQGATGSTTASITRAPADESLNAFDVTLAFNPAVVSVANVAAGTGWSLMPAPRIDNSAGTVQVVAVRFDTCATNCPIFTVSWDAVAPGTSPLTLVGNPNERLAGMGQYVTAGFTPGSVTVSAPPTQVTPTAVPTSTPPPPPAATPTQPPATVAPGAPSSIHPGSGSARVGESVSTNASVSVTSGHSVDAFALIIVFDPGLIKVLAVVPAAGWSLAPQPVIDSVSGRLTVSGIATAACSGACSLFSVTWEGLAPGVSLLRPDGNDDAILGELGSYLPVVFSPGSVIVTAAAATPAPATSTPTATPTPGVQPTLPQSPGWNLATWGGDAVPPAQLLAGASSSIEIIYVWDPESGKWRRFGPNLPSFLNDLKVVHPGDVIWLNARNR